MDTPQPWDRRPGELDDAYEAFWAYLRQPKPRKALRLYATVAGSMRELQRWYSEHCWAQRAAAWDAHLKAIQIDAFEEEAAELGREYAQIYTETERAAVMLAFQEVQKTLKASSSTPEALHSIKLSDVARVLSLVQASARLARGESTNIITGRADLSHMPIEKLEALETLLSEAEKKP